MKLKIVFIFVLFSMFFGCKTVKNSEISTENKVKIVEKEVIKYVKDSVFVEKTDTFRQFFNGDTVVIERIKWTNIGKLMIRIDTLRLKDSIFVDKIKIDKQVVTEKLPFYKRFWFGFLACLVMCISAFFLAGFVSRSTSKRDEFNN